MINDGISPAQSGEDVVQKWQAIEESSGNQLGIKFFVMIFIEIYLIKKDTGMILTMS
jgi:ABC-type phosphate/phosphonate transport system substrate-binding protein